MRILNKTTSVFFQVTASGPSISYAIYKLTDSGDCYETVPVTSGIVLPDFKFEAFLPDGKYKIRITPEYSSSYTEEQEFFVYYNRLPEIIRTLRKIFCKCSDCSPNPEKLNEEFFKLMMYLNCTGLIQYLPGLKAKICSINRILSEKEEYKSYYGDFKFDFEAKIKEIFAYFYAELYNKNIDNVVDESTELPAYNIMFNVGTIEKCLYDSNMDLQDIITNINKANCLCNE